MPTRLAWVTADREDPPGIEVFLRPLPGGPTLALTGVAAAIWLLAADGSENIVGDIAVLTGVSQDEVRSQVVDYLGLLVSRGLLQQADREFWRRDPRHPPDG